MTLPPDFQFSQSSLQDYVDCARRFDLGYLQRLVWPAVESEPALEHEGRMQQGADFHHRVHQHALGIPAKTLSGQIADDTVKTWWEHYLQHGLADLPEQRHPEIALSAPLGDYRLIAKYDLIAIEPGQRAVIVDWKTSRQRPLRSWLGERLQTRVCRYLLVVAGAHLNGGESIPPDQVEMVYWFAEHPQEPERFAYDADQFKADEDHLLGLVAEIEGRSDFPLTPDVRRCHFCTYRSLCERGDRAGNLDDWLDEDETDDLSGLDFDLDQIAEIEF
jgi:hypothetical protein